MKTPKSLYSRLALITSVTLVVGYFVVYAVYQNIDSEEVASNAIITSTLMGKIKNNLDTLNTQVTDLTATVVASSIWSKVGSDINYTAGKVGIGTVSPNKSLHIQTPTGTNAELDIQSGTKPLWGIYHDETTEELRFWNGANRVVIGSTGNVGIGTTSSPGAKLDIAGDVLLTGGGNNNRIYGSAKSGNYGMVEIYNGTTGNITFQTTYPSAHINLLPGSSGNVGIGTTNPAQKLSVAGTIESTSGGFKFPDGTTQTTSTTTLQTQITSLQSQITTLQSQACPTGTTMQYLDANNGEDTYGGVLSGNPGDTCDGIAAAYVCPINVSRTCTDNIVATLTYRNVTCRRSVVCQ